MSPYQSGCTIDENFETKTVGVGDDVTLTCPRDASWYLTQLFWLRLVSGDLPEVLGGTNAIESDLVEETPGFTAKKEPGTFVVIINGLKLGDTGLYFCVKRESIKMTVLKGTFLQIKVFIIFLTISFIFNKGVALQFFPTAKKQFCKLCWFYQNTHPNCKIPHISCKMKHCNQNYI
uniref:Ig-like domain-containing protein n=1 Tax=Labrus bergylta TaxID=56723 RepID=A0A3Q3L0K4_9LABR